MSRGCGVVAILLIALLGVSVSASAWHTEHSTEYDCAVCKLRHQPLDTLVGIDTLPAQPPTAPFGLAPVDPLALTSSLPRDCSPRAPPHSAVV